MKNLKIFICAILLFNFAVNCQAQTPNEKSADKRKRTLPATGNKIRETKPPEIAPDDGDGANAKTLAEGFYSAVTTPFVFVARTQKEFVQLRKLVKNLPNQAIDFDRTAIVAAFAGEKNTGGYSLEIAESAGAVSIKTGAPPPDAMVMQVITAPYKIVLVNVERENGLNLDLSSDFTKTAKNYRVASGTFESSGGTAGARKKFAAHGAISVLSFGEYVTFRFALTGKGKESGRKLNETISGAIAADGKINIARVEAADFIERPHRFMTATGALSKNKLSLIFVPGKRDSSVSDGFSGGGKLEAIKVR